MDREVFKPEDLLPSIDFARSGRHLRRINLETTDMKLSKHA
jgi:hypothetical protein